MLLGVAFGIAVGANWASVIVIPLALGFMLYLAPGRRTACLAIVAVAAAIAGAVLLTAYFFDVAALMQAITGTEAYYPVEFPGAGIRFTPFWAEAGTVVSLLFVAAAITYLLWRRTRYFGNTAPLLVFAILCLGAMLRDWPRFRMHLLIFMIVFIAGLAADLLESKHRRMVLALLVLLLGVQVGWALEGLLRTGGPK